MASSTGLGKAIVSDRLLVPSYLLVHRCVADLEPAVDHRCLRFVDVSVVDDVPEVDMPVGIELPFG